MNASTKRLFVGNNPNIRPLEETGKRKQMQESIQPTANEWQTTFDSIKDPIMILDSERKRSAEQLERRLQFEELLSSLSSSFVGLASDGVDEEIEKWLRRLAEFFEVELCTLGEFSDDGEKLVRFLEYRSEGIGASPSYLWQDERPWFIQQLAGGNPVVVNRVEDLPAKAVTEREVYLANGLKSVLAVPLASGGKPLGVCTLFSFRREWVWPKGLIQRFQLVTKVFTNVLERQRTEEALRQESALNAAVLDTARAIVLVLDAEGKVRRFNRYCEELSGYTFDEVRNRHLWDFLLIPEEVEAVKKAFEKLKMTGSADYFENYWKTKDGKLRRLAWSSMVIPDSKGNPELIVGIALDITSRKQMEEQLQARLQQIEELKLQLERENVYLREETKILSQSEHLVGESKALKGVLTLVRQVAPTSSTVLILGETGTGKELVAQAIHNLSQRKGRIMVKVNCASLPAALVESELFGREKGAYTGALTSQIGRFGLANGSTLFLDEIAELSLELQAKLLRVLQEGEFERLGCPKTVRVDVRVITASNRNVLEEVQKGKFREDLYYRLKVFPIEVPPLRKRPEDIPSLVWHFIEEFSEKMGKNIRRVSKETVEALQQYSWPGNVRELRNVIEQAFIMSDGDVLKIRVPQGRSEAAVLTLKERDYQHILEALGKSQWHIKGPQGAARLLGLKPSTLYTKMNKLGIPSRRLKAGNPS